MAMQTSKAADCEVLIVGGGMVGLTLGLTLAGAGVEVVVVDRADPATVQDAAFDGRASAIARGSQQALSGAGLWDAMAPSAQPILDIRVTDGRIGAGASSLFLHYDHRDVDDAPLGCIVENRAVRRALHAEAARRGHLRLLAPQQVIDLERGPSWVEARLGDGRRLRARLAVAAEGRTSPLREAAGIRTTAWSYPQAGIVCTVAHERPHQGVAHEHFLPAGPFAMLPMTDAEDGTHRSSIVWTERRDLAPAMMALGPQDFAAEIARRFGDSLGRLEAIGGRWSYPLSLLHAERYVDRRLALIGDAAHAIHPIAGQGLNLGLRDVAALAEAVVDARRLGLDLGEAGVLARYERWRRLDTLMLIAATDGLNRLFSNDLAPLRLARDLGLAAVDRLPPLKRLFMGHAMGLLGDLPRLIRGEAL
ncbi:MAG: UbiH/UbiF/VisC/COQ6 family ubiquinone biosynthesis hydroxylase [Rhodospirillales bacterium]|nr:UbiH/UbiF/VisC/COQ6 family ubiquinone biosynthesis hydroxylase [Rhodospirillales bacterium]MDH3913971.1 UbiH/UbiF/VisC/COQ6 family ubiquinone biosynthesis hydroxylase [Rhodospirillales bacterium]MDH3916889.1 UbiH/UbiF/VisC/COQ6 family ubiquinone biosynthesis hydroxylase [Rhodospirillales bacterium]MDH3968064.1 UbiH/UbiF/VisC/COQ6 family ubiquinone biosynthesis hydroxylase [Rhodospirillales bacterium]